MTNPERQEFHVALRERDATIRRMRATLDACHAAVGSDPRYGDDNLPGDIVLTLQGVLER